MIRDHQNEIDKFFKAMKGNAESIKGHVEAFAKDYRDVLEPFITKTVGDVKSTLTEARNILTEINQHYRKYRVYLIERIKTSRKGEKCSPMLQINFRLLTIK